jgi:hypothetical protein
MATLKAPRQKYDRAEIKSGLAYRFKYERVENDADCHRPIEFESVRMRVRFRIGYRDCLRSYKRNEINSSP